MAWGGFRYKGGHNTSAYLIGDWEEIIAIKNNQIYRLGSCQEGVLRIKRRMYRHKDTQLPKRVDMVAPIRTGMSFDCDLEEINAQNVSMLLGQTLNVGTQNYIYVGPLGSTYYYTLRGLRTRSEDRLDIEFQIHKVLQTTLFSLTSGDSVMGSPLYAEGMDDTAGDYGGNTTMPIGWIYVPTGLPPTLPASRLDGGWGDGLPDYVYDDAWGDGLPDWSFD